MKKIVISLIALVAATPVIADSSCGCKTKNCNKQKKVRVVYVGAPSAPAEPEYIEPVVQPVAYEPAPVAYMPEPEPVRIATPHEKTNWYLGGRVGVDMLTWKNKYTATPSEAINDPDADHDSYVFEPVFGGDIFIGYHFNPAVRGDIELGYISQFTDTDNGVEFKMSTFYATMNAYYDFINHFYLGAGVGFAFPRVGMEWEHFVNSGTERDISMMFALMGGYTWDLAENVVLDLRYRLSGHWGTDFTRAVTGFNVTGTALDALETHVGFVLDNQVSIGLRYEF